MEVKFDCRYYRGDRPCDPHKREGVHCPSCGYFDRVSERVLIIKLGAAGDVVRTTPLLWKIKDEMPRAYITWATDYPELLPSQVDQSVKLDDSGVSWLASREFDVVFSLDKDPAAIALAERTKASRKFGFGMDSFGHCRPLNDLARLKWQTGLWDDRGKGNTRSYPQEIFEICGYTFSGEPYILEKTVERDWKILEPSPLVGLNTGCGSRWPSRLWPDDCWVFTARELKGMGLGILWLGGPQEHEKNRRLCSAAGGWYPGNFSIPEFVDLVDKCDVVVTQVTMTLHIAIALKKRLVLMNNIFNRKEFELYGCGEILEPPVACECYFEPICPHDSMNRITPQSVIAAILRQIQNGLTTQSAAGTR
jgi:hypothetical protein